LACRTAPVPRTAPLTPYTSGLFEEMRGAIRMANRSPAVGEAFRVLQFSVQNDHVHLIVEARDGDVLARGVQGLAIRLAKKINGALRVHGPRATRARALPARPVLAAPGQNRNSVWRILIEHRLWRAARS
jgi:REP element-mobilizing transposase RayT